MRGDGMDSIVTIAIVGTGQLSNIDLLTNTSVDTLAAKLNDAETERKLLLTAGALAVYRKAGRIPELAPEAPQPAKAESLAACSSQVAHLIQELLQGQQRELLPEALERLKQAGLRLPYELLPLALGYGAQSRDIRSALVPVLGERGRWLSQFEKNWSWLAQFLAETTDTLPADAETIWQEGTLGQRRQLLERLRAVDPAKARLWLSDVWKKEKAETRTELLTTLKTGLSPDDEPFLEQTLDDRSEIVRATGALLLASIPASALAQRMLARADAMLTYSEGKLTITLPTDVDKTWQRDGITEPPQQSMDTQTWHMRQVLSLVPPMHWEERFAASPAELLASIDESDMGERHIEYWSYATTFYGGINWFEPLWSYWCEHQSNALVHNTPINKTLAAGLPQKVAEHYVQQQIEQGNDHWYRVLEALPIPWSKEFGDACLEAFRTQFLALDDQTYPSSQWQLTLAATVLALPPTCFDAALAPWEFPQKSTWQIQQWKQQLKNFIALIRKRKRIIEEI